MRVQQSLGVLAEALDNLQDTNNETEQRTPKDGDISCSDMPD